MQLLINWLMGSVSNGATRLQVIILGIGWMFAIYGIVNVMMWAWDAWKSEYIHPAKKKIAVNYKDNSKRGDVQTRWIINFRHDFHGDIYNSIEGITFHATSFYKPDKMELKLSLQALGYNIVGINDIALEFCTDRLIGYSDNIIGDAAKIIKSCSGKNKR